MIQELLQSGVDGLKKDSSNYDCGGFSYYDAIIPSQPHYHDTYYKLAKSLYERFPRATKVLELGCGAGNLASHFRYLNPNAIYITCDINADVVNNGIIYKDSHFTIYTDRLYKFVDSDVTDENVKFDLILSYEHFEHIPQKYMDVFLYNIKSHMHEDTYVVATASTVHGASHTSPYNRDTWISILNEHGFSLIDEKILNTDNVPFNFPFDSTNELIFRLS